MNWLISPDAKRPRKTPINSARMNEETLERYEGKWELLLTPTDQVPVLLPGWMREKAMNPQVGLRPRHRWRDDLPMWT